MEIWKLTVVCCLLASFYAPSQSECPPDCTLLEWAEIYDLVTFITIVENLTLFEEFTEGVNKTLFAPTDLAFNKVPQEHLESMLKGLLLYHVSPELWYSKRFTNDVTIPSIAGPGMILNIYKFKLTGPILSVNGAGIQHQDIVATNGIMHIIDSVLYRVPEISIFNFLANCGESSTFLLALTTSELSDMFKGGAWTLFVPNNAAFDKLPDGVLYDLLNNKTLLKDTVLNHVVNGTYYEIALRKLTYIENLDKRNLTISIEDTILEIDTAAVVEPDIPTYTGVVHVIDTVLLLPTDIPGNK